MYSAKNKPIMKNKILLSVFIFSLIPTLLFALPNRTEAKGHLAFSDSTGTKNLNVRISLIDSLRGTNYKNSSVYYDNSAIFKLSVMGELSQSFRFESHNELISDYTNRFINSNHFNPSDGIPYTKESDNSKGWNRFRASLEYDLPFTTILAGYDYLQWGVAKRNPVILRGSNHIYRPWMDTTSFIFEPAPTPYFGYQFEFGRLSYTQYATKLYHKKNTGKYLNAHRLQINLPFDIELGASEMIIYGTTTEFDQTNPNPDADSTSRHFEWVYAIPFIPYLFAEPLLGDLDNNALAFDIRVNTLKNYEFYGELFFDDLANPLSMFDDSWWGNKWAASIGFTAKDFCTTSSICFSFNTEYTRVEPWVYTHHKGAGYTYSNYGSSLGSDLGPNSQELYTRIDAEWNFLQLTLEASAVDQDTAFGGNLYDIHTPLSDTDKSFLEEESTIQYVELKSSLLVSPTDFFWTRIGYSFYFGDYKGSRLEGTIGLTW
jgi:hypothetical protein